MHAPDGPPPITPKGTGNLQTLLRVARGIRPEECIPGTAARASEEPAGRAGRLTRT